MLLSELIETIGYGLVNIWDYENEKCTGVMMAKDVFDETDIDRDAIVYQILSNLEYDIRTRQYRTFISVVLDFEQW